MDYLLEHKFKRIIEHKLRSKLVSMNRHICSWWSNWGCHLARLSQKLLVEMVRTPKRYWVHNLVILRAWGLIYPSFSADQKIYQLTGSIRADRFYECWPRGQHWSSPGNQLRFSIQDQHPPIRLISSWQKGLTVGILPAKICLNLNPIYFWPLHLKF